MTQEIRRGRKFDQVLDGARAVFLRDGYDGASVDDIAKEAGVSKATLYAYVPDKRLMFLEVVKAECKRQATGALALITPDLSPRQVLEIAAEKMIDWLMSDFGQSVFRICVAEADRFPDLGRQFYESGPLLVRESIVGYLRCAVERQELQIEDFDLAADQFQELCKADLFPRMIFGLGTITAADRERTKRGAVDMFLARYGRAC